MSFTRFSRHGTNLGRLHVTAARHSEGLDGTDTLEITCTEDLIKNDYIVWRDRQGIWHEHIVDTYKRAHDDTGAPLTVATCINSIAETWDDYVTDRRPSGSAYTALTSILATSRWTAGTCTQVGTASHTFYHISVREAIQELLQVWGGELETVIGCDGNKVTSREVRITGTRGNQYSAKRFTWSKDLISISREVASDNPKTRLYAYGKGEETESGGYGRRIGIESVNDGLPYVEDAAATAIWGHPMPDGTTKPSDGVYLNENCADPAVLLEEVRAALEVAKTPVVTYTADVVDLVSFGREWEDVSLGDLVTIIDREFSDDGLRLKGRVAKTDRDLLTYDTAVTFGTLVDAIANPWQSLQAKIASLNRRASNWDLAGTASGEWLETLIAGLNAAYNQAGTYHYSSFEKGEIWSSVPLDEDGNPTISGGWAMNINGLGFRLASSTNADGSWNWRTFGNGEGFTSDEMITGTLKAGIIRDATDGGNYWNLDTGDFRMVGGAMLGDKTVQQVLSGVAATITNVDVEYAQGTSSVNAPETGWSTTAPAYEAGKYIWSRTATTNASSTTYSTPVMISGRDGEDGVGISSTTIRYGTSASATTEPNNWQATVPTVSQGQWLWVRTVYAYTDSSSRTTYTKSYVGTDGEDGTSVFVQSATKSGDTTTVVIADSDGHTNTLTIKDGEDGDNGTAGANGYVHTAWATSADGSQGFSTSVSTGKTYLGVYTDNTAADSQRYQDYSWSLIKGTDGEDGVGITSIVEQYYLSTSNQTQTGGDWSATQPTWESGKYIWTRSYITWDDGRTDTTDPVLATALTQAASQSKAASDAVDAISTQQAIFNLLTNSGALQGLYMSGGQLYVNASYILGGTLVAGGANNVNGVIQIQNSSGSVVGQLDCDGASLSGDLEIKKNTSFRKGSALFSTASHHPRIYSKNSNNGISTLTNDMALTIRSEHTSNTSAYVPGTIQLVPGVVSGFSNSILSDHPLMFEIQNLGSDGMVSDGATTFVCISDGLYVGEGAYNTSGARRAGITGSGNIFTFGTLAEFINATLLADKAEITQTLTVGGSKSRLVETDNYGNRLLYCYEMPSPMFGDIGSGVIGGDGTCYVLIDDVFTETARMDLSYQVFLQRCGQGDLYVAEKHPSFFIVCGTPGLVFDWEVKARQTSYESERLDDFDMREWADGASETASEEDYLSLYAEEIGYINDLGLTA